MSTRVSQLEHAILELGTEMYRLRHQISSLVEFQETFLKTMRGLKGVLDEKGLISKEDFEAAVDLTEAMNTFNNRIETGSGDFETERAPKKSHSH